MENPAITTAALPLPGNANPLSAAAGVASTPAEDTAAFAALLQRELGRDLPAAALEVTVKSLPAHEPRADELPQTPQPVVRDDNRVVALLPAPVMLTLPPQGIAQPGSAASHGTAENPTIAGATPSPLRERALLVEPASEAPPRPAGPEANLAASGKESPSPAAATGPAHDGTGAYGAWHRFDTRVAAGLPPKIIDGAAARPESDTAPSIQAAVPTVLPGGQPVPDEPAPARDLRLAPHVGAAGWDGALAQKVLWLIGERMQTAELRLNPPHLGPLEVQLTIAPDRSGIADAQFASPHAVVREAIEAAMPRLREALAESGITLGNTVVADGSFRQQQDSRPEDGATASRRGEDTTGNALPGEASPAPRVRRGLIDTFA